MGTNELGCERLLEQATLVIVPICVLAPKQRGNSLNWKLVYREPPGFHG